MHRSITARLAALVLIAGLPGATIAASAPPTAGTAALPASARLEYATTATMQWMGLPLTLRGHTVMTWKFDGTHYDAQLRIDRVGFTQHSEGRLQADGALAPERYTEKRPFHHPDAVMLDWARGQVRFGGATTHPAPKPGAQDRLSVQFEFARRMERNAQAFHPGDRDPIRLIGTHDVDDWKFTVGPAETVGTGLGPMPTIHLSARRPAGRVEETMDIWLGAKTRWLPVRIRIVDRNGSVIDSVLQTASIH